MGIASNVIELVSGGFVMGWGPCLAYTAPFLLPYIGATKLGWREGLRIGGLFVLGRLLALAILGALATVAFSFLNRLFPPHVSAYLYLVVGIFILALGVLLVAGKRFALSVSAIPKQGRFGAETRGMLLLGFLFGIAPCAPLIAVLTYIACVAENIAVGVLYAVSFGTGAAVPLLMLSAGMGIVPEKVFRTGALRRSLRIVCGAILILFGGQLIYSVVYWLT